LKDTNFIEISKSIGKRLLNVTEEKCYEILNALEADSKFLASHNIMDYSLLLVVETAPGGFGYQEYHIGIIDYLQKWTLSKKLEKAWKTTTNRGISEKLSAIAPEPY